MRTIQLEFLNSSGLEFLPTHIYMMVGHYLGYPPFTQIGLIDIIIDMKVITIGLGIKSLAENITADTVSQLSENLEIGFGFAHWFDDLGAMDIIMSLVPRQGHVMTLEVCRYRQQHVGPQP